MVSLSKTLCALLASCAFVGCATNTGSGEVGKTASASPAKTAAASCMSQIEAQRQECEARCPKATGNEHFTIQHKLAMEHAACKEECAAQIERQSGSCKSAG